MSAGTRRQNIGSLALVVPDYDAAIGFYVGRLGFALLDDIDQGGGRRWVRIAPPGGAIGDQAGGRVFLFLHTDDFARDHAAMVAAGVTFEDAPRHEPYGIVAVWRDPFGNRWDLLQPAQA